MRPAGAKTVTSSQINGSRPSPLKINKDSRIIHNAPPRCQPVIIYTHSPKIIHTKPHDFMALVQKLTGMSSSSNNNDHSSSNDMSSSIIVTEDDGVAKTTRPKVNALFGDDIPLFTPKSLADFFCSPRTDYRFSEGSPNWVFDFVEGVPEY